MKQYGIALEDAWVFGDSMNDLSMFQYVPNAVVMGKHDAGLESYATFTAKTVEEDGIYRAMEELGKIREFFKRANARFKMIRTIQDLSVPKY